MPKRVWRDLSGAGVSVKDIVSEKANVRDCIDSTSAHYRSSVSPSRRVQQLDNSRMPLPSSLSTTKSFRAPEAEYQAPCPRPSLPPPSSPSCTRPTLCTPACAPPNPSSGISARRTRNQRPRGERKGKDPQQSSSAGLCSPCSGEEASRPVPRPRRASSCCTDSGGSGCRGQRRGAPSKRP